MPTTPTMWPLHSTGILLPGSTHDCHSEAHRHTHLNLQPGPVKLPAADLDLGHGRSFP
jgi:hypothetical protein